MLSCKSFYSLYINSHYFLFINLFLKNRKSISLEDVVIRQHKAKNGKNIERIGGEIIRRRQKGKKEKQEAMRNNEERVRVRERGWNKKGRIREVRK